MPQTSTSEEQARLKDAAHAALAKVDYLAFKTYIRPGYETPTHIRAIAHHLQMVEDGTIKRLMIILPPRHGKSEAAHGDFPAWCLGKDQTRTIIGTSYAADLAEKFSEQNRDCISDNPRYRQVFPGVSISTKLRKKERWALQGRTETYRAAGVGGGITGFGAWLLLIDDPVKDQKQASSPTWRKSVWDWYLTTSRTRLTKDGRVILIMTRWHDEDLGGMILASDEADQWTVLHLPALSYGSEADYEHLEVDERKRKLEKIPDTCFPDPLNRPLDGPLWAARFDQNSLFTNKLLMGHHFFALYQGHPQDPEGNLFKREWYRTLTPETLIKLGAVRLKTLRSYDLAWSSNEAADETISIRGSLYEIDPKRNTELAHLSTLIGNVPPALLVLSDGTNWREEWDDYADKIVDIAVEDGPEVPLLIEAVAAQSKGFKSLRRKRALWKHSIFDVHPDTDKLIRSRNALYVSKVGCVIILTQEPGILPPWAKLFLAQLTAFGVGSSHDDWVDAFTQLVDWLMIDIESIMGDTLPVEINSGFNAPNPAKKAVIYKNEALWMFREDDDPFGRERDGLAWRIIDESR